jgi:MerR, DNA binding
MADHRNRSCQGVDAIARQHLAEVERKIVDLNAMRRELCAIIDRCANNVIADCRIIEALSPMGWVGNRGKAPEQAAAKRYYRGMGNRQSRSRRPGR